MKQQRVIGPVMVMRAGFEPFYIRRKYGGTGGGIRETQVAMLEAGIPIKGGSRSRSLEEARADLAQHLATQARFES
jgi:hypothetical protein